ncbi:MAG: hypothetical protein QM793_06295 [Muricomes sp.]
MKVCLMDENGTWNLMKKLSGVTANTKSDLELDSVFSVMAQDDMVIYNAVQTAFLLPLVMEEQILYRQQVLSDCLRNDETVRELYRLVGDALVKQENPNLCFGEMQSVSSQFNRCMSRLKDLIFTLRFLRNFEKKEKKNFHSKGFQSLFRDLNKNLDDNFFAGLDELIHQLQFPDGMLIGAKLTKSGSSFGHELLYMESKHSSGQKSNPFYEVKQGNSRGVSDLLHRRELAISKSNRILVRAISFVCDYLNALKNNLGFYIGCLNLHQKLTERKIALCIPVISQGKYSWSAINLTELNVGLKEAHPVANNLKIENSCCIITGADLGGKTTFLRAAGQNQMMMQCGMFVAASFFSAPVKSGIFTHFQREEDHGFLNGKLGEEFTRMNEIIDSIKPGALLLCDETFCSTNEREGSEIAWQITKALREKGISVFMVTHLFPFAQRLHEDCRNDCTFLCSERLPDGERTKRILPGAPQRTSFCEDLYQEVFTQTSIS